MGGLSELPKSVDVRWSYSVQRQCRFFLHTMDLCRFWQRWCCFHFCHFISRV